LEKAQMNLNTSAFVNVSVSSHYREPSYSSEVITQGILAEEVEIIRSSPLFTRIRQKDGYESWIDTDQLALAPEKVQGVEVTVRRHFLAIYAEPDAHSERIRDAVIGCRLTAVGERGNWTKLLLPDGRSGWARKDGFGVFPQISVPAILSQATEFSGYPYFWGGRSPRGFDCSGFVQTVFALLGLDLPRDAWQQQQKHMISRDWRDAEPGDLLFFAKIHEKVTHVAIYLGAGRFIHASGWVRINSLSQSDPGFSEQRLRTFVSVNRYPH
jgi:cell wall-associated NlpC family hydrolase